MLYSKFFLALRLSSLFLFSGHSQTRGAEGEATGCEWGGRLCPFVPSYVQERARGPPFRRCWVSLPSLLLLTCFLFAVTNKTECS